MTQINRKWIADGAIDHTKLDSSDSYVMQGLTIKDSTGTATCTIDSNGNIKANSITTSGDETNYGNVVIAQGSPDSTWILEAGVVTDGDFQLRQIGKATGLIYLNGVNNVVGIGQDTTIGRDASIGRNLSLGTGKYLTASTGFLDVTSNTNIRIQLPNGITTSFSNDGTVYFNGGFGSGLQLSNDIYDASIVGTGSRSLHLSGNKVFIDNDATMANNLHVKNILGVGADATNETDPGSILLTIRDLQGSGGIGLKISNEYPASKSSYSWRVGGSYGANGIGLRDDLQDKDRILINSDGSVIIGSSATQGKLDVAGTIYTNQNVEAAGSFMADGSARIEDSIGIGTTPQAHLHLYKSSYPQIRIEGGNEDTPCILSFYNYNTVSNDAIGILDFRWGGLQVATIEGVSGESVGNSGDLVFRTKAGSGSITERMRIDSTGHIGIGISPSSYSVITVSASDKTEGISAFTSGDYPDAQSAIVGSSTHGIGIKGSAGGDGTAILAENGAGALALAANGISKFYGGNVCIGNSIEDVPDYQLDMTGGLGSSRIAFTTEKEPSIDPPIDGGVVIFWNGTDLIARKATVFGLYDSTLTTSWTAHP